jgi:Skp family chaperone for outer membrane proteins
VNQTLHGRQTYVAFGCNETNSAMRRNMRATSPGNARRDRQNRPAEYITRPIFFPLFGKFTIDAIYELCHIPRPQLPLSLKFMTDTTAPRSPRSRAISRLVRFCFERRSRLNVKKLLIMLTLAAGLCGAFVWLPDACGQNGVAASRSSQPAVLKIAYIDMGLVLQQYKKTEDINQEVKMAAEAGNATIKQMVDKGRELEKPMLDPATDKESPEFLEREKKVIQLSANVSRFKAVTEKEVKLQGAKAMLALHQEVIKVVEQFAEQNNYTLVLRIDREALAAKSYKSMALTMDQTVLHHDGRTDISDAVIAYLNKQYDAAGGATAPAPASPKAAPRNAPAPRAARPPLTEAGSKASSR